jgi:ABC-type thiamin/hydroxymethylpyrimidine transport system permease subunit
MARKDKYKLRNFIIDAVLTICTGGLWLIWVFCREMRR